MQRKMRIEDDSGTSVVTTVTIVTLTLLLQLTFHPIIRTQFQQTPFWTKSTRCLVVSWSNLNSKFNFKQLCPLKSQNPTYGSQVTAISAPPPALIGLR